MQAPTGGCEELGKTRENLSKTTAQLDDSRPRSTAPPPQSPQGTANRRYLPVGRTTSDVMPTATFTTAHLHVHSDYDTSRRQESHNTLVPTEEKTCTFRARRQRDLIFFEKARKARVLKGFPTPSGSTWLSGRLTISVVARNGVAMTRSRGRGTPPRQAAAKAGHEAWRCRLDAGSNQARRGGISPGTSRPSSRSNAARLRPRRLAM